MTVKNYASWEDHELRRALGADPDDINAIFEAAKRFEKQSDEPEEDEDSLPEITVNMECPECSHRWDEEIDPNDYL